MSSATTRLSFKVSATGADLRLIVTLDKRCIYDDNPGMVSQEVVTEFSDSDEQEHILRFEMQGKRPEHTVLSTDNEILQDRLIKISDLCFDAINLGHLVSALSNYYHDTNGSTDPVVDRFFGSMGCNGCVELRFKSPIYLWLLENM